MKLRKMSGGVYGWLFLILALAGCSRQENLQLKYYYDYDQSFPLEAKVDTLKPNLFHVTYNSTHGLRVPALLSLPRRGIRPYPVVIMLHGIGDQKNADYMMLGDSIFSAAGFAVFRPDIEFHGERARTKFSFKESKKYRYTFRDALVQTVFDLRRAVDYLDTRPDIDSTKTAFLGISLGGIIGTVFCGVEKRVEFPIITLAGGGMRYALGKDGLKERVKEMLAPIEPLNFVAQISPRPVLFQNAKKDEIIPKTSTMLLYATAKEPKEIIWYDAHHHMPPRPAFRDAVEWLQSKMVTKAN